MNFEMIAANELDNYVHDENAFIIDLRTPQEYNLRHIEGAVNIPYQSLRTARSLPYDMTLIVYCERGSVSMVAAKELAAAGYRVKTVIGGLHAYHSSLS